MKAETGKRGSEDAVGFTFLQSSLSSPLLHDLDQHVWDGVLDPSVNYHERQAVIHGNG